LPLRTIPPKPKLLPKPLLKPKPNVPLLPRAAPVARLEEFSLPDSPVRPPRAPRLKAASPSSPPPRPKPFFLPAPEVKVKSASLGREAEAPRWDEFRKGGGPWPVRPPRRKNRGHDVSTHQLGRSISLFGSIEEAERNIPIYATVNYNLKKNRRGQPGSNCSKSADFLDTGSSKKYAFTVFNSSVEILDKSNDTLDRSELFSEISEDIDKENKKIYEAIESNLKTINKDIADLQENFRRSCENLLEEKVIKEPVCFKTRQFW